MDEKTGIKSINLELSPEQIEQLESLRDTDGSLKVVYQGAALKDGKLVLSYIACNVGMAPKV
jgi:hypothetical protein